MSPLRRSAAAVAVTSLIAVPATLLAASPAGAVEKTGRCGGAQFQLSVEKDDGRFEVEADIDDARPGSRWRVVLRHDGQVFFNQIRTVDAEGDISVDRDRRNTAGRDAFRLTVKRVGSDTSCSHRIVRR